MVLLNEQTKILQPQMKHLGGQHPVALMALMKLQSMCSPWGAVHMVWGMDEPRFETFRFRFIQGQKHWDKVVSHQYLDALPMDDPQTPEWGATWTDTLTRWMHEAARNL